MKVIAFKFFLIYITLTCVWNHSPKGFKRSSEECAPPKTPKMNFFLQEFTDGKNNLL